MALNLRAIKVAAADQIRDYIDRKPDVRPFRTRGAGDNAITIEVTDITQFETFGPAGYSKITANLKIWCNAADDDSAEIAMDDYLSAGTGNGSSIADAINSDKTLGGVVESCAVLELGTIEDEGDDFTALIPLEIYTKKVGAQA